MDYFQKKVKIIYLVVLDPTRVALQLCGDDNDGTEDDDDLATIGDHVVQTDTVTV